MVGAGIGASHHLIKLRTLHPLQRDVADPGLLFDLLQNCRGLHPLGQIELVKPTPASPQTLAHRLPAIEKLALCLALRSRLKLRSR